MTTLNQTLNPLSTPLNTTCLIEASAGTGKTYTIGSLYLRLLLQAGDNCFAQALTVEQILVVTFTEAATEELRARIRERITATKKAFQYYKVAKGEQIKSGLDLSDSQSLLALKQRIFKGDDFLVGLASAVENELDLAIKRLVFAEQTMDMAAIYTIHSFCRRGLVQYAFNSGIHFDFELLKDQQDLLRQLVMAFWRENFYALPFTVACFVHQHLGSPAKILQNLGRLFSQPHLTPEISQPDLLRLSLSQFLQNYISPHQQHISDLKTAWLKHVNELQEMILTEITKVYKKGEKKRLYRRSYQERHLANWLNEITTWAKSVDDFTLPKNLTKYFSQSALNDSAEKEGGEPLTHEFCEQLEQLKLEFDQNVYLYKQILMYHYLQGVQQKLLAYKNQHKEKGFDDLLRLLHQALYGEQGETLAQSLRHQYPFAMIDEFQDTDRQQYEIFDKLYVSTPKHHKLHSGFIMIGDPKQAIYKFRGADIFTYLSAADKAEVRLTLDKNWRSEQSLVEGVNGLFDFSQGEPFLYSKIPFLPVKAKSDQNRFVLNGQIEPAFRCYIGEMASTVPAEQKILARTCAISIQQWLQSAVQNQAFLQSADSKTQTPLEAKRIAVLVRNRHQAATVQEELKKLGIASVYLSDDSCVFDSEVAKDLWMILQACLNPLRERAVLNAVSSLVWGLNVAEINQIKQDEQRWTNVVERFVRYQQHWHKYGVLAMLHKLFLQEQIGKKLLSKVGGERQLTDLLHLAELLQQASNLQESAASLLRWFEKQILGEERDDEQHIRLESESQLVKIVTLHKSKGLEYDLVWLPFIAIPMKENTDLFTSYYDEQQECSKIDVEGIHQKDILFERQAEEMRLLYVALTRAKYQVAFALPASFKEGWNALRYALTEGKLDSLDSHQLMQTFQQKIASRNVQLIIEDMAQLKAGEPLSINVAPASVTCTHFTGKIEQNWQITSFSRLAAQHEFVRQWHQHLPLSTELWGIGKDYDGAVDFEAQALNQIEPNPNYPAGFSPFDFPAGMNVGRLLHSLLEQQVFNQQIDEQLVVQVCQQLQLTEEWQAPLQQWLHCIINTPLLPTQQSAVSFKLSNLANKDCLKELGFYLQLKQDFNVAKFNQLLAPYYPEAEPLCLQQEGKAAFSFKGLMNGFIDLVCRHQGKYYILDYKSNLIGLQQQDYGVENLRKTVLQQHYHWQYLFYTLALHRYLSLRDPAYQYERDFGGVIYPFLRAMNGKTHHSVYVDKPAVELITQLGELF